ncbi:protein of unknown function [Paenibacillus alvei]|uniref:Uncharacterized protein n=1 Tax=Paenibacillus alvei TaxID=44250 RepID=A0A383RJ48_PAEAL|nr:protein of unknown function [Paenibacillus alvei]
MHTVDGRDILYEPPLRDAVNESERGDKPKRWIEDCSLKTEQRATFVNEVAIPRQKI